ncbi:MAG: peptidase M23 [Chitinophagaceae bacterium]|nr:MAG: peptidase M23 [Chitinophagaceae bacterium]
MAQVSFRSLAFLLLVGLITSCSIPQGGLSGKSLHADYADGIRKAGLQRTAMGAQWLAAADKSLTQPIDIVIPYKETAYFAADKPLATCYRFSLQRGEKAVVKLATVPASGLLFFAELWQPQQGENPKWLAAVDTVSRSMELEIKQDGKYLLRVQPELLQGVEYTLTINTAPSIAFPVRSTDNPKVSSFWGADRDAGARRHEGIDIFAKFRTPAIAAANGRITRVNENALGGKVIFLRPEGKDYSLYYAHLDTQLVQEGAAVRTGDTLGLIGNTGNAKTTPPHLHFGIYTNGGAINPFPFVNVNRISPKNVSADLTLLNEYVRSKSAGNIHTSPATTAPALMKQSAGAVMKIAGATEGWYRILLPDGSTGFISGTQVSTASLRKQKLGTSQRLLDQPDNEAAAKLLTEAGASVEILGQYGQFYLVNYKSAMGWIPVRQD